MVFCCVVELIDNRLTYHENTAMQNVALCQEQKEEKGQNDQEKHEIQRRKLFNCIEKRSINMGKNALLRN